MAPPVDVSVGTSLDKKDEFEEFWQKNFKQYEDKISPADYEFQENMLANGKDSPVGGYFTAFTSMDFLTKPLSREEILQLKPATVIAAESDGMTYVGREEPFHAVHKPVDDHYRVIVLGDGTNWKSKTENDKFKTGHNIFDYGYLQGKSGGFVYNELGNISIGTGNSLDASESTGDVAKDIVDRYFRHYSNFFAFRELIKNRVEYVTTETEDRQAIIDRRGALEDYFKRLAPVESQLAKLKEGQVNDESFRKAADALRERLGIKENLTLARAQEELALPPLTEERKKALEVFVELADKVEEEMKTTYVDEQYNSDLANLQVRMAKEMANLGLTNILDYKPLHEQFANLKGKNVSKEDAAKRGDVSRIHQELSKIQNDQMGRFGVERNARIAKLNPPEGVRDVKTALRELKADRSPERRQALLAYVQELPALEAKFRADLMAQATTKLNAEPKPVGVESVEDARRLRDEVEARLNMYYAPPGDSELAELAGQVKFYIDKLDTEETGSETVQPYSKQAQAVKELRNKKAPLMKAWEARVRNGQATSDSIKATEAEVADLLQAYKDAYFTFEHVKGAWLRDLKRMDLLNEDKILAGTAEVSELREKVQSTKQKYFNERQKLEEQRWQETAGADLIAVTKELRIAEEALAARDAQISVDQQLLNEWKYRYAKAMEAKGLEVPYTYKRVEITTLLDQPLSSLLEDLRKDGALIKALQQTLTQWDPIHAQLRVEANTRDTSGY